MGPGKKSQGFTIIELVIVMAIGMVLVAVATPSFLRTIRTFQLNAAARNVGLLMQSARYEAVRRNRAVGFVVSQGGTLFWIDPNVTPPLTSYTPVLQTAFPQISVTGGVSLVSGLDYSSMPLPAAPTEMLPYTTDSTLLVFSSRGTLRSINQGASPNVAVLSFQNADGGNAAVTITPSGTVKIWTLQGSVWK